MGYEVANEKLGIMSCRLGDLTAKQVASFLAQWEEGAAISSLTLFYDSESQNVVLNKDNPDYELYLMLTEKYLAACKEKREELAGKLKSNGLKEAVMELDKVIKKRDCAKTLLMLDKMPAYTDECGLNMMIFDALRQRRSDPFWNMYQAFIYGIIQGKRIERAKKKA